MLSIDSFQSSVLSPTPLHILPNRILVECVLAGPEEAPMIICQRLSGVYRLSQFDLDNEKPILLSGIFSLRGRHD